MTVIVLPAGASSAFVGYQAFVRPALNRLQGEPDELPRSRVLPARVALHGHDEATELIPAIVSDRGVEPTGVPGAKAHVDAARCAATGLKARDAGLSCALSYLRAGSVPAFVAGLPPAQ